MEESILNPSPNWFQVSGMAVSQDGWLVYGGPSKCICILEPLPPDCNTVVVGDQAYKTHVLLRAASEKIVSVDISPEWLEKKLFLAGSSDGSVKQWSLEMENNKLEIKCTHCHDKHLTEKEEIIGVGYSTEVFAVTVGCFGNIVKWNLNSNVVKKYPYLLKSFKPVCMSCSPHVPLQVAVGTKRGVIFVVDLTGPGKILNKVRGYDDEIINLCWCPQYEVTVKKSLVQRKKLSAASQRLEKIRNEPNDIEIDNVTVNSDASVTPDTPISSNASVTSDAPLKPDALTQFDAPQTLDDSGVGKILPEDSFDESIVVEDDMFDIYKDHEPDEFGHKKYQPEEIVVQIKEEEKDNDFLAECMKLKEVILKRKDEPPPSIQSLVEAIDRTHVHESEEIDTELNQEDNESSDIVNNDSVGTDHVHKHLLATISKYGAFRIWSKGGKLVGSCTLLSNSKSQKIKGPIWPTLLWYKPDLLIVSDGKSSIYKCNALKIDSMNKLETKVMHSLHKRGVYCIVTDAPRIRSSNDSDWSIWTVAQDRNIIKYCLKQQRKVAVHATCGGYIYTIQSCPYDAGKVAVSVGDGAVRVWETSTLDEDETKLCSGQVITFWQNVLGKVLSVSWHPTKENLLAFSTAEARVGLIDTSGKFEKPARILMPALSGAVYAICWGANNDLFACSGGKLIVYRSNKPNEAPEPVVVQVEGQPWELSEVRWYPTGLFLGAYNGGVALLSPTKPYNVITAMFAFKKMIHCIDLHPRETSHSSGESPHRNLIAVSSLDKENIINILNWKSENPNDEGSELTILKSLSGHQNSVYKVIWNPHTEAQLLSSSRDDTVRVWDVVKGVCISIYCGHSQTSIAIAWSAFPHLSTKVMSGGGDCTLRLWDINDHPADAYEGGTQQIGVKSKRKLKCRKEVKKDAVKAEAKDAPDQQVATSSELRLRVSKRFLMPLSNKQMIMDKSHGIRLIVQNLLDKQGSDVKLEIGESSGKNIYTDYIKIFGSVNDINDLLDMELKYHLNHSNIESWIVLSLFRGHIDTAIQFVVQRNMLCPFLLSMTPCVSSKYWKEVSQLYIGQIDRLVAKQEEDKLCVNGHFGGPIFRKVLTFLSIHDVKSAVSTLVDARLFKEAYVLCKIRYMDSIAEDILRKWAYASDNIGNCLVSAVCYAAQGNISSCATVLGKSTNAASLRLAAELAKVAGHNTFADHIIEKMEQIKISKLETVNNNNGLPKLPSRAEAIIKKEDADYDHDDEAQNDSDSDFSE